MQSHHQDKGVMPRGNSLDFAIAGEFATMAASEFARRHLPDPASGHMRAADFLTGRSPSEAIQAALAAAREAPIRTAVVLDAQDWLVDRAVLLASDVELLIDGCTLKLADGVFDNIIRSAGIKPDSVDPHGSCQCVEPMRNIRIRGRNGAVIEGAEHPYTAANPKTGVVEPWVGDFFGWRTVGILLAGTHSYEISGFTMRKTHCWAISQEHCTHGYLHDISFDTCVKNGDGIDFRNGCSFCLVDHLTGTTSDDTVACTALGAQRFTPESKYVHPMQCSGLIFGIDNADVHDIAIRNIFTGGRHHAVICLATSPSVYNISIENVVEASPSCRESCVKIYTGYGSGYRKGNLRNIAVRNVTAHGAHSAVVVKAAVTDVCLTGIRQLISEGTTHHFEGDSTNLTIMRGDGE